MDGAGAADFNDVIYAAAVGEASEDFGLSQSASGAVVDGVVGTELAGCGRCFLRSELVRMTFAPWATGDLEGKDSRRRRCRGTGRFRRRG